MGRHWQRDETFAGPNKQAGMPQNAAEMYARAREKGQKEASERVATCRRKLRARPGEVVFPLAAERVRHKQAGIQQLPAEILARARMMRPLRSKRASVSYRQ